jgi:lipid-binding SYLF domain-containing protein
MHRFLRTGSTTSSITEETMTNLGRGTRLSGAVIVAVLGLWGCAGAPETREERAALESDAEATLAAMTRRDPTLGKVLDEAAGYVVFPTIGESAVLVGGAQGVGVVYADGEPIGYAVLRQGSIGAQLGGRSFSELIILRTPEALARMRSGNFDLTANVSATALESGAGRNASFENGVGVFVDNEAGLMASAAVGGQQIDFEPTV